MKPTTIIQGTVCKPEHSQTSGGKALCRFLVMDETPRGKSIYPVTAWGGLADSVAAMRGRQVLVTARIDDREYNGRHYIELVADGIYLAAETQAPAQATPPPPYPSPPQPAQRKTPMQPSLDLPPKQRPTSQPQEELDDIPF